MAFYLLYFLELKKKTKKKLSNLNFFFTAE